MKRSRRPRAKPKFDAAVPLRNVRWETFARHIAANDPPLTAARASGYETMSNGNAWKLRNHPHVVARVAAIAAKDNDLDMVLLRRNRLRQTLETIARGDRSVLVQDVDVPLIIDGAVIRDKSGATVTVRERRPRPLAELTPEERMLIEIDGDKVKSVPRLDAIAQLRKLDGLDRPDKLAITDPDGQPVTPVAPVINLYGRPDDGAPAGGSDG